MLVTIIEFGIGVVGITIITVEQQHLRVFLCLVGKQIHRGADTSSIEPVVNLSTPTMALVLGFASQCGIGHPGMFETVEMQHSSCLYLTDKLFPVLIGVSTTC